ncbi:HD-GYP domain-containing protein [Imhoffiella purpurea]|uniref:HD-GYP domain-containing protein n=1 Tax=Imhoffiella purpurea TaxID=1249627 RepID=W9VV22_9GAMM|nr:HD-GYP domain-containing protein [Imhoffiella purpurea]EXJ14245.1 hypothetical protein D779_2916 [Imhoffiella purpurea]
MIKKIAVEQLQLGMYVHDLNCGWLDHGFIRNRFSLKSEGTLERIRQLGIRELYIDTEFGLDVEEALTETEVTEALEEDLAEVAQDGGAEEREIPLGVERTQAKRIHGEAAHIVAGLMNEAKLGKLLDLEQARATVGEMTASIHRNQDAMLALSRIRRVGRYHYEHSVNLAILMICLARSLGLERQVVEEVGLGGLLHDIGKVMIPARILNKPGRLTDQEFTLMRSHVDQGRRILSRIEGISPIAMAITAEHHERIDGSGYPERKPGASISRFGKMAAIVDVYDAMSAERVYHKGVEPHQALRKLLEWRHHLDPELVQQFIRCVGIYPIGTLVRLRSGRLGVVIESGREDLFKPVIRVVMDANRRQFLSVSDLDLSRLSNASEERILGAELPKTWGIDPQELLMLPS